MTTRLEQQIAFLNEADKLKSVTRGTLLCDASRAENSAEHSWHLTLFRWCWRIRRAPMSTLPA